MALLINRYNDRLLPLLRQFLLIANRMNKLMDLKVNYPPAFCNQLCWDSINIFSFTVALSILKTLGVGTSGSAVCISLFNSLIRCIFNS